MQVLSSLSGITFYAPSAGFAPTNSAEVSAIASSYQVVSATATQLNAGTAYLTSVNDTPISASRAGNAVNATQATSAWYDGTGRLISALPDSAAVSAIASSYAESAASSKQDTLTFGYDADDKISSINGSSLAGEGGGLVTALGTGQDPWYQTSISSINGMNLSAQWADSADNAHAADIAASATYAQTADFAKTVAPWVVSAYISAVTSRSGTIIVTNRTGIDATDSAVVGEYVPGYSGISTYAGNLVPFNGVGSAVFTGIPDSLPVTASLAMMYGTPDTVTFSGSNGTTASASYAGSPTALTADLGKVSSVYVYTQNQYIQQYGLTYTADAVDNASIVALAHASALPTYQYDAEDKISSINGSAIAGGGGGGLVTAIGTSESGITSINNSGLVDTAALRSADYSSLYVQEPLYISASGDSSYIGFSGTQVNADWTETASSAPSYIENKPDLVDIVAGPGIVIDNPDGNTLRVSTEADAETVLWEGTAASVDTAKSGLTLTESPFNFEYVEVHWVPWAYNDAGSYKQEAVVRVHLTSSFPRIGLINEWTDESNAAMFLFSVNGYFTSAKFYTTHVKWFQIGSWNVNTTGTGQFITRIVGIHRIANN